MLVVKRPTALVFGWEKASGKYEYISDIFSNFESLMGWVDLFAIDLSEFSPENLYPLKERYKADVIVVIGPDLTSNLIRTSFFDRIYLFCESQPSDVDLANMVLRKVVENHCNPYEPFFSVFTPAYKTGERIFRTYDSLKSQSFTDWEWIVVDDSPEDHTDLWQNLIRISQDDFRVKPIRINPNSDGSVGKVKKRACALSKGKWLVELDHDDELMRSCLSDVFEASKTFPDAGFIYSDCSEIESDGEFRKYDDRVDWDFYGASDNYYNFGYSGHTWVEIDGKRYLQHHSPSINPVTIRFNVSMPNHVRCWRKDVYDQIGGHSETLPLADDFELIIRTFLETRMVHIRRVLYLQHNNKRSTVDMNSFEINRLSRVIKDVYNERIHQRILDLGYLDWEWDELTNSSKHPEAWVQSDLSCIKFGEEEQVLNYTYN